MQLHVFVGGARFPMDSKYFPVMHTVATVISTTASRHYRFTDHSCYRCPADTEASDIITLH